MTLRPDFTDGNPKRSKHARHVDDPSTGTTGSKEDVAKTKDDTKCPSVDRSVPESLDEKMSAIYIEKFVKPSGHEAIACKLNS